MRQRRKKRKGKIPQSQCAFVKPLAFFLCLRVVFETSRRSECSFEIGVFGKFDTITRNAITENVKSDKEEKLFDVRTAITCRECSLDNLYTTRSSVWHKRKRNVDV